MVILWMVKEQLTSQWLGQVTLSWEDIWSWLLASLLGLIWGCSTRCRFNYKAVLVKQLLMILAGWLKHITLKKRIAMILIPIKSLFVLEIHLMLLHLYAISSLFFHIKKRWSINFGKLIQNFLKKKLKFG